jgi:hypothetical protein
MGQVSLAELRPSTDSAEQPCKFGTVVRALWPTKPALNLAQRIGCTERGAQYLIDGKRRPSARALLVLMAEVAGPRP